MLALVNVIIVIASAHMYGVRHHIAPMLYHPTYIIMRQHPVCLMVCGSLLTAATAHCSLSSQSRYSLDHPTEGLVARWGHGGGSGNGGGDEAEGEGAGAGSGAGAGGSEQVNLSTTSEPKPYQISTKMHPK